MKYPLIEDHGIIGNLNTVALIGKQGSINFMCFPYFDSPTIFASLLDKAEGGHFSISPIINEINHKQMYIPDTNVLLTRFLSSEGVSDITDFMPVNDLAVGDILIRRVTAVKGEIKFKLELKPRFDYGRSKHKTEMKEKGVLFTSSGEDEINLYLQSNIKLNEINGDINNEFTLKQGEKADFLLKFIDGEYRIIDNLEKFIDNALFNTMDYWKKWIEEGNYTGLWLDELNRSALVLKLLISNKYGSTIASPTFGLPETPGGVRNWDYRYCWIRDASFSLYALIKLGYVKEARHFMEWVEQRCEDIGKAGRLSIMYTVSGKHVKPEITLENFEGYKGAKPVRIGNNAAEQVQLDIYGELIDAVYLFSKHVEPISYDFWEDLINQINWLRDHWRDKDEGIWEVRGGKKNFLYSRLMCWVAFDRMIKMGDFLSYPYPNNYKEIRDQIFHSIYDDFWDEGENSFVQYKGAKSVDASMLLMPIVKFISPKERRWLSTLERIEKDLVSDSLVYRYRPYESDYDPFGAGEGTFSMCTFWYIECLSRSGQLRKARFYFEKMLGYGNHLGLFAEQLSFNGEHLGNFPQAFTHLGLIGAGINLNKSFKDKRNRVTIYDY